MSSVQQNSNKISTNLALIQNLQQEIIDLSNNIPDLTNVAKLNVDNTFTANQFFTEANVFTQNSRNYFRGNTVFEGDKTFVVNITPSATSGISFLGREVNIQSELLCGNGPTAHIDAKISGVLSVNQTAQGGVDDRTLNYIKTPKVEITTAPVDLTDATTKDYVDTAIAGSAPDLTNYARIDTINTFAEIQTFLKDINAEEIDATKYKINDGTNEYVYGEYSNTYYVNDNEGGISGSINDVLALLTQGQLLKVSAGSYAGEDVLVEKTNIGISAPIVGGRTITEIGTVGLSRTLTIDNSERIRMDGFQINGLTTINGTLHKHYFSNMNFNGGLSIDGGVGEFMIFKDCEINVGLTISPTFGGVIYFYRVNFQNQPLTCNQSSPLQVIMIDCAGIPDDASLFAGNYFVVGLTSFYKSGVLTTADLNPANYVRNTTPSQDNELASKLYVDTEVATNTSAIATNTSNIATNTSAIGTNTSNIATNTSDIANKQDTLIAGDNITITGTTISSTGGGGGSAFVGFRAAGDGTFSQTIAFGQTISAKLEVYAAQANSTFDTESGYLSGIYTIPTGYTGWWEVSVKIYMLSYSEGGAQIGLRQNSTTIISTGDYQGERGDFTTYVYLTEGNAMSLRQDQNSGQYSFFANRSWWQMRFIGETLESVNGASSISSSGSSGGIVGASWSRGGAINGVVVNNAYSTNVSIPFSVQQYPDVNCLYNAGDYIEIQISGKYLINYGLMSANNNTTILSFLRVNFGNNRRFNAYAGDSGFRQVHCSMILDLVAGDNIDVVCGVGNMIASEEYRYFNGHLIN